MSRIRSKLATAVALAGTAVGATLVTITPASAATAPCPANNYCFYSDANYANTGWHLNYNETTSGNFNNPPSSSGDHHDQLSSIINNGNRTICIYDNHVGRPDTLLIKVKPYQDVRNLAELNGANDKADHWKVNC